MSEPETQQSDAPHQIHNDEEQVEAALRELEHYINRADVSPTLSTLDPNLTRARDHLRDVVRDKNTDH